MLDCRLSYKQGPGRNQLIAELIKDLPDIIVAALAVGAGLKVTPQRLVIELNPRHPEGHNIPDLELVVMTGRGEGDRTYNSRELVRRQLRTGIHEWLERHPKLRDAAKLDDVDAIVRFAESCGANFSAVTGVPRSMWGGPRDDS